MNREISILGDYIIRYSVQFKDINKINLRITPQSTISVSAPIGISILKIDEFVVNHIDWIRSAINKNDTVMAVRDSHPGQDEDWILYEGNVCPIVVNEMQPEFNISIRENTCVINLMEKREEIDVPATILNWRTYESLRIFSDMLKYFFKPFEELGYDMPTIKTQRMKTRWGSYSPATHTVKFNTELLKTPPLCIKLIIIHELCHLMYYGHNKDFYCLHQELMPEYKSAEKLLKMFCREWHVL